jgi:hypothetical protein
MRRAKRSQDKRRRGRRRRGGAEIGNLICIP